MNYVYALRSLRNKKRYIGSTRLDPEKRLKQHNHGSNKWSRQNGPFELVYYEECATFREARKRESYLKTSSGRRLVDRFCKKRAASSVG
jgi:putative endonuclease